MMMMFSRHVLYRRLGNFLVQRMPLQVKFAKGCSAIVQVRNDGQKNQMKIDIKFDRCLVDAFRLGIYPVGDSMFLLFVWFSLVGQHRRFGDILSVESQMVPDGGKSGIFF